MNSVRTLLSVILTSTLLFQGCTKSPGGENGTGNPTTGGNSSEFTLSCGAVIDGAVKNPLKPSSGELVTVLDALGTNLLAVQKGNKSFFVKLHGVSTGPAQRQADARSRLRQLSSSSSVYFFKESDDCKVVLTGNTEGVIGQLVNAAGVSFSEDLITRGLADVEANDSCSGTLIGSCLKALQESNPQVAGVLNSFLWKPQSDSNGNLAIHSGPYDTTVIVNGESGQNQGPGNGYGSLARFSHPGCAYPSPRIQVIDNRTGLPYSVGGKTTFTVGNPCGRNCLQGGSIVACSKS